MVTSERAGTMGKEDVHVRYVVQDLTRASAQVDRTSGASTRAMEIAKSFSGDGSSGGDTAADSCRPGP